QSHVIYFAERGSNPRFQTGYFKGVWEGFWAMWMIIATGEYLEKDTPHPGKRAVTIMFWLLGALFVATFTATITSNLTLRYLTSNINGPNELAGKRVVTVRESAAAKYLVNHRIGFVPCPNIEECYKQLLSSQADAVVFDAPVLQYFSWHEGNGKTLMVGPIFDHVPFGMALPFGSPLRKRINEAILQLFQDGTSEEINKKWFGSHIPEEEQSGFLAKQR
ncbi:MAG: transporter substrate-binding domain-containing protein, partial [Cyanobacteria bacterium]|nr:transporter substrate-binding domain-containing protein [Cyanobacteriota bacterium]